MPWLRSATAMLVLALAGGLAAAGPHQRAAAAPGQPVAAAAGVPQTVPALRHWSAGPAQTTIGTGSRILVDPAYASQLTDEANTFAEDIAAQRAGQKPVVVSAARSAAAPGDLYLALGSSDTTIGAEGYVMESGGFIAITARSEVGAFYGTRTVLQLLKQSPTIAGGIARDWPSYPERGMRVDTVTREFSTTWWHNLIRDLSYVKLNMLNVLLIGGRGLNDGEIDELVRFSTKYHVTLIPTVAIPSHSDPILDEHPYLRLEPSATTNPLIGALDFTHPRAEEVIRSYVERYIDRFPGPYWHTSADEYLGFPEHPRIWDRYPQLQAFIRAKGYPTATGRDALTWFLNWMNALVKSHGKKLRVWNDYLERGVVQLDPDIVVEHWYQPNDPIVLSPQELANPTTAHGGHRVLNVDESLFYHDQGHRTVDPRRVYDQFQVHRFSKGREVLGAAQQNLAGGMIAFWLGGGLGQYLESNEEIVGALFAPLRSLAQVTWNSPKPGSYDTFKALVDRIGRPPGYTPTSGIIVGNPVQALDHDGRAGFFARTTDGALVYGREPITGQGPGFATWPRTTVATGVVGDPVVKLDGSGRLTYFIRSANGQLLYGRQIAPGSTAWQVSVVLSGAAGDASVALDADGRLAFFVRSADGQLWHGLQQQPGTAQWTIIRLATGVAGDPVSALATGKLVYFVRTSSGWLRHGWQSTPGGPWSATTADLVPGAVGKPAIATDATERLVLFVRTTNGDVVHRWQQTPGGGWNPESWVAVSNAAGDPTSVFAAGGKLTLFVRKSNGDIVHRWQHTAGGGWSAEQWVAVTGAADDPVVRLDAESRLTLFVRRTDGSLVHRWQHTAGGGWNLDGSKTLHLRFVGRPSVAADRGGRLIFMVTTSTRYLVSGMQFQPANSSGWFRAPLVTS